VLCEACWRKIEEHELATKVCITRPHEIKSRGAGGKCIPENQFSLCKKCHDLWHQKGGRLFVEDHDHLKRKAEKILGKPWHKKNDTPEKDDYSGVFI